MQVKANASLIAKIKFIRSCQNKGLSQEELYEFAKELNLPINDRLFINIKKILDMPVNVLCFCDEKHFSFKQCLNLANYPKDLVTTIFSWKNTLHLTASLIEEFAENLRDYLRRENKTINDFIQTDEAKNILTSEQNAKNKTNEMRNLIRNKLHPTLTKINSKLQEKAIKASSFSDISINWDKTLENKGILINIDIKTSTDLKKALKELTKPKFSENIESMLKEM